MIVRNGIVLYAPGDSNTGRNIRLANSAQRRALRALYRCCSIPGCTVSYDRCKLHHIIWWRNGGHTNLASLTHPEYTPSPSCSVRADRQFCTQVGGTPSHARYQLRCSSAVTTNSIGAVSSVATAGGRWPFGVSPRR